MKLTVLDTMISLAIELDKKKLVMKEDGTSRLIVNSASLREPTVESIVVIEFDKKHTKYLKGFNPQGIVIFIEGTYQVLKNKKEVPFIRVNPIRVIYRKKKKILRTDKFLNKLRAEFETEDLEKLKDKYKELCIDVEIEELKETILKKEMLNKQEKINRQELTLKRIEASKLKRERVRENEEQIAKNKEKKEKEKTEFIKWYSKMEVEKFIDVDVNKIELRDEIFYQGKAVINLKSLKDEDKKDCVVIKAINNEKYELVMGLNAYIKAKILNKPVKALITDLNRESFIESIKEKNNK